MAPRLIGLESVAAIASVLLATACGDEATRAAPSANGLVGTAATGSSVSPTLASAVNSRASPSPAVSASASAPAVDRIAAYLDGHHAAPLDAATEKKITGCKDVRVVLAIADSRADSTLRDFVVRAIADAAAFVRVKETKAHGELALEATGWGDKTFSRESRNFSAVMGRCPDVDTCRAAMIALEKQPAFAAPDASSMPRPGHPTAFLVCGVPNAIVAWGQPSPIPTAP